MNQKLMFILLASAVVFLVDLYVFQAVRTVSQHLQGWLQRGIAIFYWLFFVVTVLTLVYGTLTRSAPPSAFKTYLSTVVFIVFVSKLIVVLFLFVDDGIRLGKYIVSLFTNKGEISAAGKKITRSEFLNKLALFAGLVPFTAFIYGIVRGAFEYQVKKITVKFPNLPESFHGFRMLQISDLHTGSFHSDKHLKEAVALINKQEADIVLFTGDLVNNVADEVQPYLGVLGGIQGKMGVYSVLGNHDYGDYVTWDSKEAKHENLERLKNSHTRMGWRLLMNEHVKLERGSDSIALLGIENWGAKAGFPKYGKMYRAYAGAEDYPFKVLLSHDPSHWDAEVREKYPDIDLMLSGHTHGMQFGINLPHLKWSPVQYVYKQWAGLYKKGRQQLYVNVGLGFLGYPGRVGFLPEITVIELQRS